MDPFATGGKKAQFPWFSRAADVQDLKPGPDRIRPTRAVLLNVDQQEVTGDLDFVAMAMTRARQLIDDARLRRITDVQDRGADLTVDMADKQVMVFQHELHGIRVAIQIRVTDAAEIASVFHNDEPKQHY